ncbi:MAG: nucleotidyltransferase domain-containing protein [Deltaproteobacteria bacterium]|nr:nucleotidyltransferase domain-containing protein [Deltaproteobacteria bacterium]
MTDRDRDIARQFKAVIERCGVPVVKLILYGSRARGDATDESDLDLMVVLESADPDFDEAVERVAWQVGFDSGIVVSTVVFTRDELEKSPLRCSPFVNTVQREGIAV